MKMKVLQYNQSYLTALGLSTNHLTEQTNEFLKTVNSILLLFGLGGLMFPCSAAFGIRHINDITLVLRSILLVCACVQCLGAFISIGMRMKKVKQVHIKLQEFVDNVPDMDEMRFYVEAEEKCQKLTKFVAVGYISMAAGLFVAALLFAAFCIWMGNFDTSTWLLPYSLIVPFDTSTLYGWLLLWLCNCYIGFVYSLSTTCAITYFVSCCFYIIAMCEHFDYLMKMFDTDVELKQGTKEKSRISSARSIDLKRNLNKIVEVQSEVYKVTRLVVDVNTGSIFWLLSCNIVFFAAALYQIENTIGNLDLMILYDILCLMVSLLWPFGLCYAATMATTSSSEMTNIIYNTEWYKFPHELRKYLPFMMARSQIQISFIGFGIVGCNLPNFVKINNSASSFYLMFRSVAMR